jgi:hypothetical protein
LSEHCLYNGQLYHHGIKGQRWGVRRFQNKDGSLTSAGMKRYAVESDKVIKNNPDGSKTIPRGFAFNRIGKSSLDVNQSGALYVSHGREDAARYIKNLGPTTLGKLFGTAGEAVQHLSVKSDLKLASDSITAKETAKLLLSNKKLMSSFNESIYSSVVTGDFEKSITNRDLEIAMKNPNGKEGQKLAYGVSSFLGDPNYANETKAVYAHFRNSGYDAIPDLHDTLSGTSKTAMIIINPDKVEMTSSVAITKDVMKEGKKYVRSLDKLKVSDLIDE